MDADRSRADAQACKGCMTKLAILASAVRGRLTERAELCSLGEEPCGSARSTVSPVRVQDHGQRVAEAAPALFPDQKTVKFDSGLEH
jgi:hypothetical protein